MKYIITCTFLFIFFLMAYSQENDPHKTYNEFKQQSQRDYSIFVDKQNQLFIDYLKDTWRKFKMEKPQPCPFRPEPSRPVPFDNSRKPDNPVQIAINEVIILPHIPKYPENPDILLENPQKCVKVDYYGSTISVPRHMQDVLHLDNISEKEIAKGWEVLCHAPYKELIANCLKIKEYFRMNDWGYVLFSNKLAEVLCAQTDSNEKVLIQMFILSQSGYKAKIARINNRLTLMIATDCLLYSIPYIQLNEDYYFLLYEKDTSNRIYTYQKDLEYANQKISMRLLYPPILNGVIETHAHQSKNNEVCIKSQINKTLITFYKDYPQCEFTVYAQALPCKELLETMLPPLENAINGKSEIEAANLLLNFVQTAFEYQTDEEQFGYEKPFFIDEIFFYPYSDCEDRAILYQYLIKTLLKLDVALLDYPEHLATAVKFNSLVEGDFIMVNNQKYIVCDPTYINADIGYAMPQFKNVKAKVIMIL